jgi:hypothetical protein
MTVGMAVEDFSEVGSLEMEERMSERKLEGGGVLEVERRLVGGCCGWWGGVGETRGAYAREERGEVFAGVEWLRTKGMAGLVFVLLERTWWAASLDVVVSSLLFASA